MPQPHTLMVSFGDGSELHGAEQSPNEHVFVRLATSKSSPPLNLAARASGMIALEDGPTSSIFQIAVAAQEAPGPFWRTRVVTFSPYRVLVNRLKTSIEYQQVGTKQLFRLNPDEAIPWHWSARDVRPILRMRVLDPPSDWSGPFPLTLAQPIALTLRFYLLSPHD